MARAAKAKKADPLREAAVDYFSSRSHNAWRKRLLETNPEQRGQPRMRLRGGAMVDINKPWASLDPKAKADNKRAAYDAYDAVKRFPGDREAAANYVHERWMQRNKGDKSQPKALFKAYARLPEVEKDKDRAHVDRMKAALRAVSPKKARKAKAKTIATKTVQLDAETWARIEAAAIALSKALGRSVSPEALLVAGAEAVAAVARPPRKAKKA
jgi:hypothetical protein